MPNHCRYIIHGDGKQFCFAMRKAEATAYAKLLVSSGLYKTATATDLNTRKVIFEIKETNDA